MLLTRIKHFEQNLKILSCDDGCKILIGKMWYFSPLFTIKTKYKLARCVILTVHRNNIKFVDTTHIFLIIAIFFPYMTMVLVCHKNMSCLWWFDNIVIVHSSFLSGIKLFTNWPSSINIYVRLIIYFCYITNMESTRLVLLYY